ncbi:MAG TPA: Gfo/Idh/MocA family oxidoreductase [Clostridiales bacterium]|nr:Gfo/Idh/MocA family oxidoreductase [Clostridiales bacterium]
MDKVRVGVIGIGNMGSYHAKYIDNGEIYGAKLTAVCDINPNRLKWAKKNLSEDVALFDSIEALFESKCVDGVIIATPHYDHPPIAIEAFEHGLHVLIEKPAGVYTRQVREMNEVAESTDRVFGIMYNQRTNPIYRKVRDLVKTGELGDIKRTIWIITSWYRPQSYYDSGGWRATWAGEGGGVLLNQDPHQLDLWQWMVGMPKRVRAFCYFGKYHDIEVEDDVMAYVEYENGATGLFVTSTGEAPGTNRFEISADRGKLVVEDNKLTFWRLRVPERQFNAEWKGGFGEPECWECDIPIEGKETGHRGITQNWIDAILKGDTLLAPGTDGIKGLEISNAMHLSSWIDNWVDIPVDEDAFYNELKKRIETSTFKKKKQDITMDVDDTF